MQVISDTKKEWVAEFDSLVDFVNWIESTDPHPKADDSSTREGRADTWDLGAGYKASVKTGKAGGNWKEGADMVVKGIAQAAEKRNAVGYDLVHDLVGFVPDVPAYLAGDPESMMRFDEQDIRGSAPVIKIGAGSLSASTSAEAAVNKGVALLSLVDALEEAGYRCEVSAIWDNRGYQGHRSCISILAKQAGEPWNPATVAYLLAHPAARRRLGFAGMERGGDASATVTRQSYGNGTECDWEEHGVDIPFEYMRGDSGYRTLDEALRTAERKAAKAGYSVKLIK